MAQTLEASNHTSVQRRIKTLRQPSAEPAKEQLPSNDAFLSPLAIDEQTDPVGPCESKGRTRFLKLHHLAFNRTCTQ
jgi:hypothetical protein